MRTIVNAGLSFQHDTVSVFIEFGPKWLELLSDAWDGVDHLTRHRFCNSTPAHKFEAFKDKHTVKWYIPIDSDKAREFHNAMDWPDDYGLVDD